MRKKTITKLAGLGMAVSVFMGGAFSALASENLEITQDTDLSQNPAMVTVTAEVGGQYTVTIPKVLVLTLQEDGGYATDYTVDVDGRIADNAFVSVIPQSEITIATEGKDPVPVTVTQGIKYFRSSTYAGELNGESTKIDAADAAPEATGNLRVKDGYTLTSGSWEGQLFFDIAFTWDGEAAAGGGGQTEGGEQS